MSKCDQCLNYEYNEELDCCECIVDLDMDEMEHYTQQTFDNCPFFRINDEYSIVRKQN